MTGNRRQFLQSSLAAGSVLTLAGGDLAHGDVPERSPREPAANPDARPGRVRWHADFDTARKASQTSGKPVLLFHMLGRLDQRFC